MGLGCKFDQIDEVATTRLTWHVLSLFWLIGSLDGQSSALWDGNSKKTGRDCSWPQLISQFSLSSPTPLHLAKITKKKKNVYENTSGKNVSEFEFRAGVSAKDYLPLQKTQTYLLLTCGQVTGWSRQIIEINCKCC